MKKEKGLPLVVVYEPRAESLFRHYYTISIESVIFNEELNQRTSMICTLCTRESIQITRHHLIPRTRHSNKRVQKMFTREQMNTVIPICRPCHSQIHALFSEKELEHNYHTLETVQSHPRMVDFIDWIKNKPDGVAPRIKRSY